VQIGRAVHRDPDFGSQRIPDGSRIEEMISANEITSIAKEFRLLLYGGDSPRSNNRREYLGEMMHFPRTRASLLSYISRIGAATASEEARGREV